MTRNSKLFAALVVVTAVVASLSPLFSRADDSQIIENYQQQVRAERPSVTYLVFEPAVIFYRRLANLASQAAQLLTPRQIQAAACRLRMAPLRWLASAICPSPN